MRDELARLLAYATGRDPVAAYASEGPSAAAVEDAPVAEAEPAKKPKKSKAKAKAKAKKG